MEELKVKKISESPELFWIGKAGRGWVSICRPFLMSEY